MAIRILEHSFYITLTIRNQATFHVYTNRNVDLRRKIYDICHYWNMTFVTSNPSAKSVYLHHRGNKITSEMERNRSKVILT